MDWRYNTIWFDQIAPGNLFKQDLNGEPVVSEKITKTEYAILWRFKRKAGSFDGVPASTKLLYLELNGANIIDFGGIGKLKNLKRLEVHYCTKLESDAGISALKNSLEILHIHQSKKFVKTTELHQLTKLKVLRLNSCGPVDNLKFLKNFPKLIDFRFVDTTISDGDLSPILDHPAIRSVGFSNKRHYNFTGKQIEAALDAKSTKTFQDFVHKGEHRTFKYR